MTYLKTTRYRGNRVFLFSLLIIAMFQYMEAQQYTFKYLGCFNDSSNRALPTRMNSKASYTRDECNVACSENGFKYSGRQHFGECFCGDSGYNKYGVSNQCKCDHQDVGAYVNCVHESIKNELEEEEEKETAYAISEEGGGYSFLGCFRDSNNDRALPFRIQSNEGFQKDEHCNSACAAKGYKFAGRQYLGECYCGNSNHDKHGVSNECKCDQFYVGPNVNCVYQTNMSSAQSPTIPKEPPVLNNEVTVQSLTIPKEPPVLNNEVTVQSPTIPKEPPVYEESKNAIENINDPQVNSSNDIWNNFENYFENNDQSAKPFENNDPGFSSNDSILWETTSITNVEGDGNNEINEVQDNKNNDKDNKNNDKDNKNNDKDNKNNDKDNKNKDNKNNAKDNKNKDKDNKNKDKDNKNNDKDNKNNDKDNKNNNKDNKNNNKDKNDEKNKEKNKDNKNGKRSLRGKTKSTRMI